MSNPDTFPKMKRDAQKDAIVRCMARFNNTLPVGETEHHTFEDKGYAFEIRKSYIPVSNEPLTHKNVEYHIRAKKRMAHTEGSRAFHTWGCYVYLNREGYVGNNSFPVIKGTDFAVDWC